MPFRRTNYSGYLVLNRSELLQHLAAEGFSPKHQRVVAEHITHQYPSSHKAPKKDDVFVVGYASKEGVDALLVSIDGSRDRPSGGVYHLTLSLDAGHKPFESNGVLLSAVNADTVENITPFRLKVQPF